MFDNLSIDFHQEKTARTRFGHHKCDDSFSPSGGRQSQEENNIRAFRREKLLRKMTLVIL